MAQHPSGKRYIVSNFGFGYAVQDTQAHIAQGPGKKGEELPDSSNPRNAKVLEIFPTRAQAQAFANDLNARDRQRSA
jgi:hypothetical protein